MLGWRGKNIVKKITKVSGHSLKSHFCMFEILQGKNKNLDCHNFLKYFLLIAKFTCSKFDTNQRCVCIFT
jgi:hypothetical protein